MAQAKIKPTETQGYDPWYVDTRATHHMGVQRAAFIAYNPADHTNKRQHILLGDDTTLKIEGEGTVSVRLTSGKVVDIPNVLHVPALTKNLFCEAV